MARTRDAGFGDEVKRRIILGTYALSAGYYDAYYGQAQKVRTLIQRDFAAAFEQVDVLVSPDARRPPRSSSARSSTTRWRCTSTTSPPSRPTWPAPRACRCRSGSRRRTACPVGLQIMAPALADDRLYRVGAALEAALLDRWGHPLLERGAGAVSSPMTTETSCCRLRRRRRPLRPGARPRGPRRARHRHQDVLRLRHRRSAPRPTPRPARRASACPARCRWSTRARSSRRSASAWR